MGKAAGDRHLKLSQGAFGWGVYLYSNLPPWFPELGMLFYLFIGY